MFVPQNFYPILSMFFGWLAEFGTVIVCFVLVYTYNLLKDFRDLARKAKNDK